MKTLILSLLIVFTSQNVFAWGRRGHSVVATTAAYLLSDQTKDLFWKSHSFDLGYYANVPDFIWKEPATYQQEHKEHYMDKEIFDRALKGYKGPDPYALSREEFEKKFPQVPADAGRSWWRVRELNQILSDISLKLKDQNLSQTDRFDLQARWLVTAGVLGHYIGDLSQPLHVTENFDGQMTGQNGIHSFFEDAVVDELYGTLEQHVLHNAKERWNVFHKKNAKTSILNLLKDLSSITYSDLSELLKIDKRIGHKDVKKAADAYRGMIEERITVGSLYLAEILSRQTNWTTDNNKFFNWVARPAYIVPGTPEASTTPTTAGSPSAN